MYYMISIYKGGWLYVMYVGVLYYVPKLGCSLVSAIKIFFLFLCWVGMLVGLVYFLIVYEDQDGAYGQYYSDYVIDDIHGSDIISIMVISVSGICNISLICNLMCSE